MSDGNRVVRAKLKGLHKVKRKLADGTVRTHYYAWRGGPPLSAKPNTVEFILEFNEAHQARKVLSQANLDAFITEYKASSDYMKLADQTRRDYGRYLDMIKVDFGDIPKDVLEHPKIRGDFKAWRDKMSATPRKADLAWSVLNRVLSWAKDRGKISVNVCERGGRLYKSGRAEITWSQEQIDAITTSSAPKQIKDAFLLALWTGQRQGDLLGMKWSQIDGDRIKIKQSKRGAHVSIPIHQTLRSILDAIPRATHKQVLLNSKGQPWTRHGFGTSWSKARDKAGVTGVRFNDLRGTAITHLAVAGATVTEIASVTGHSLKTVTEILDAHYLGERPLLAESASKKREKHNNSVNHSRKR